MTPNRNSLFTPTQREYLKGEREDGLSASGERKIRKDIRDRTVQAMLDLRLVWEEMEDRDQTQVFDKYLQDTEAADKRILDEQITGFLSFMFKGMRDHHYSARDWESWIKAALSDVPDVDIASVDLGVYSQRDVERLTHEYEQNGAEALEPWELRVLYKDGVIGLDDHPELDPITAASESDIDFDFD